MTELREGRVGASAPVEGRGPAAEAQALSCRKTREARMSKKEGGERAEGAGWVQAACVEPYNPHGDLGFSPSETRSQSEQSTGVAQPGECFSKRVLVAVCGRQGQGQEQERQFTVIQGREDGGFSQAGGNRGDMPRPGSGYVCNTEMIGFADASEKDRNQRWCQGFWSESLGG